MQTTQFDHFYSYQEMTDFLLECEREFPAKFRLISLADTAQGRKIWLAEITDFSTDVRITEPQCLLCSGRTACRRGCRYNRSFALD